MPGAGGQQPQRTTFRPPWVKDGPNPLPMPAAPWTLNSRRDSKPITEEPPMFTKVALKSVSKPVDAVTSKQSTDPPTRKQSKITIVPAQPQSEMNATVKPVSKVKQRDTEKNKSSASSKPGENGRAETPSIKVQSDWPVRVEKSRSRTDNKISLSKSESSTGAPTLSKSSSRAAIPPPPPPRPPPPPPSRLVLKDLPQLTEDQQKALEMLKSRPRKRPDWACMMKEVESGRKLKHVKCNDRSAPIIERVSKITADPAGKAHFVFESETSNMHNQLLQQIQSGVKLKSVKTNDRSRPILEGLRKFRRQLTIEEQMQKADAAPPEEVVPDEMDDIDAVRDDLQSTKQMLALELRNKEALERDNKRLQARILNLEAENERLKMQRNVQEYKKQDEKLAESLKKEAEQARCDAEKLEKQYAEVAEERDKTKLEVEELKRMYAALERRMKAGMAFAGCPDAKDIAKIASQKSIEKGEKSPSQSEEENESSEEDDDDDDDPEAVVERRLEREVKLMTTKIKNFKDKAVNAKKERHALKEQIKQQQKLLKDEKHKFKALQKEVDKMAQLMADTDEDEAEEEEEEEDEETESEEESESEESEEESESDDELLDLEDRKQKLQEVVKKHEGRLASLKKGNYLLKAQVDRLKDDLVKQREDSLSLQEDLDSVLAELG